MLHRSGRRLMWLIRTALAAAMILATHGAMAQTIRMWTFLNPDTGKTGREMALKMMMDGFEAANPGVKVQVEVQDYRTMTSKFFAAAQSGAAPDVIWVISSLMPDAIKLGVLANLDDLFIKHWTKEQIADVDDAFWRYTATPTAHYQFMLSRAIRGQLYRIDLLKEAGIDPKSLTTWDKLIAAAEKLTVRDAQGNVTRWGFGQPLAGALPIAPIPFATLLDLNGTLFDKNFHAAWANPAGVKGVQMVADMIEKYKITPPEAITTIEDAAVEQFGAGRMAILRDGNARIQPAIGMLGGSGKVGWFPTPSFTPGKNSPSECTGWSVAVWSGSKNIQLAGKWAEYMVDKHADKLWMTVGGQVPAWKSTLTDNPDFIANPNNAYIPVVMEDMQKNCWLAPEQAGPGGWDEGLDAAIQEVVLHHTDPKAALQKQESIFDRVKR